MPQSTRAGEGSYPSAESKGEDGIPVRDLSSVSYSTAIESAATHDTAAEYTEFTPRA